MIAITPEPVIGTSRNTDRHVPESPLRPNLMNPFLLLCSHFAGILPPFTTIGITFL